MDDLAIGSIDYAIEEVERVRSKCNQYVINDCIYHLHRAREALVYGLDNPVNLEQIIKNFLILKTIFDNDKCLDS